MILPLSANPTRSLACCLRSLLLSCLAFLVLLHSDLPAERFPEDPVESFRRALVLENNKSINYKSRMDIDDKALDLALRFREANLKRAASKLVTASDLSRALLLIEWPRLPRNIRDREAETKFDSGAREIERRLREDLAKRFIQQVRQTLKGQPLTKDDVAKQEATINLAGETVASAGDLEDESLLLYKPLEPLVEDLAALASAKNSKVREAAARALGQFPNSPKIAAHALKQLLSRDNSEVIRKAAANGLLTLAQTVSSNQPIRGSEPGVSVRETRRTGRIFFLPEIAALVTEVAHAAGIGLDDPSIAVRRVCVNALRQAAETLAFEVKILLPVSAPEISLPPSERDWSPDERELVEERRKQIAEEVKVVHPALRAFRNHGSLFVQVVQDEDPAVRFGARRALEALSQTRELLQKLRESVPVRPSKPAVDKEKFEQVSRKVPARLTSSSLPGPNSRQPVPLPPVFRLQDEKNDKIAQPDNKKNLSPDLDKDPDPIGSLLKQVGQGLLESGFRDPNPSGRRAALEALESMGTSGRSFISLLLRSLKDRDPFVRWIAARTLGKLAPAQADEVVPALIALLEDPDLDPRMAAARALGLYGPAAQRAVDPLAQAMLKGDAEFRLAAMKAVEGIGTTATAALPALQRLLRESDSRVRQEAARILGRFGGRARQSVEALEKLTTDPDSEVRKAASAALLTILSEKEGK